MASTASKYSKHKNLKAFKYSKHKIQKESNIPNKKAKNIQIFKTQKSKTFKYSKHKKPKTFKYSKHKKARNLQTDQQRMQTAMWLLTLDSKLSVKTKTLKSLSKCAGMCTRLLILNSSWGKKAPINGFNKCIVWPIFQDDVIILTFSILFFLIIANFDIMIYCLIRWFCSIYSGIGRSEEWKSWYW